MDVFKEYKSIFECAGKYRAIQTQCDQHEEEDNGPEGGATESGDGLWVHDKHQTSPCIDREHNHITGPALAGEQMATLIRLKERLLLLGQSNLCVSLY